MMGWNEQSAHGPAPDKQRRRQCPYLVLCYCCHCNIDLGLLLSLFGQASESLDGHVNEDWRVGARQSRRRFDVDTKRRMESAQ